MSRPAYSTSVKVEGQGLELTLNSKYGTKTVGVVSSELFSDVSEFIGRTGVIIQADPNNTADIKIGINTEATLINCAYVLSAGNTIIMNVDKYSSIKFYGISASANQKVNIIEVG